MQFPMLAARVLYLVASIAAACYHDKKQLLHAGALTALKYRLQGVWTTSLVVKSS